MKKTKVYKILCDRCKNKHMFTDKSVRLTCDKELCKDCTVEFNKAIFDNEFIGSLEYE